MQLERKHTNDHNVGINRESAAPRNGTKICPLCVQRTRCRSQVLVQKGENDESNNLSEHTRGDGQALDNEVRDIEVGRFRETRCQNCGYLRRIVLDLDGYGSGRRCHGGDQEYLNDLEDEVGILGEQLNSTERRLAAKLCAQSHDDRD